MNELVQELKEKMVETLDLQDVNPEELDNDAQLVGGELGIDSIDVLELVMMIEREYGVKIDNQELGQKVFATINSLAAYIAENRPKPAQ